LNFFFFSFRKFSREESQKNKDEKKLTFKEFQKLVMDFLKRSRVNYLKNFVILFRKSDTDNNGVLNEDEFYLLLKNLNVYDEYLEDNAIRLLNIIDPNNNKAIIFSECVSLFKMVLAYFF